MFGDASTSKAEGSTVVQDPPCPERAAQHRQLYRGTNMGCMKSGGIGGLHCCQKKRYPEGGDEGGRQLFHNNKKDEEKTSNGSSSRKNKIKNSKETLVEKEGIQKRYNQSNNGFCQVSHVTHLHCFTQHFLQTMVSQATTLGSSFLQSQDFGSQSHAV